MGISGVSFGAAVALDALPKCGRLKALALLSPPIGSLQRSQIDKFKGAKLFLVGERDRLVPTDELRALIATFSSPAEYGLIRGADHTWKGYEARVAVKVAEFFAKTLL